MRETGPTALVRAPTLASDVSRSGTFGVAALPGSGELAGVGRFEIGVRAPGKRKYSTARGSASGDGRGSVAGKPGKTYSLRARAIDRRGPAEGRAKTAALASESGTSRTVPSRPTRRNPR